MSALFISWFPWWNGADWIIRGVFLLLGLLSLISWSIMIFKWWLFYSVQKQERKTNVILSSKIHEIDDCFSQRRQSNTPSYSVWHVAKQWLQSGLLSDRRTMEANTAQALMIQRIQLENGLSLLASIGSSAPFIGLLGTVWGIMHALQDIDGQAALSMDMIAGPVSEALVATAVGLFTAIPAVMGYNMLVRYLRRLTATIESNAVYIVNWIMIQTERSK
ncbi:MotA/TolQ/ExbB proton channel family protein [Magnetococcales bacterium HHB-1]